MKKVISIFTLVIVLLFMTQCTKTKFRFLEKESDITKIEIVEIEVIKNAEGYYDGYDYTVVCEIENKSEFLEKFKKVPVSFGSPTTIRDGQTVFHFEYSNGSHQFVGCDGQGVYRSDVDSWNFSGSKHFDEYEFYTFMMLYIEQ